jgi:hypothetical protein
MPAGLDGQVVRAELNVNLGIGFEKLGREVDNGGGRRRDLQIIQENRSDPFINQDAPMLGIIAEFDDVKVPVGTLQQMSLGPSAHLPDQACGFNGHEWRAKDNSMSFERSAARADGLH